MAIVRILVLVAIALLPSIEAAAQVQAIRFGKLVDGQGQVTIHAIRDGVRWVMKGGQVVVDKTK